MNNKSERAPVDPELHSRVLDLIKFKGGGYNEDSSRLTRNIAR